MPWARRREQHEFIDHIDEELKTFPMRLFVTKNGFIGLGHPEARKGDLVLVLRGLTVPVILREYQDGYQVVGVAYVDNVMQGETVVTADWVDCKLY